MKNRFPQRPKSNNQGEGDGAAPTSRGYRIKAKDQSGEIWLYEEIGEGWFGGISAKQFAKDVKALGDVATINLHINSPGGDVFDGNAIYNILKQHKAKVIVSIEGLAASIASVIAMAGDEIYMADNAMMMIHPAWGFSVGNAADMRKMAELLDKLDQSIAGTYAKRTELPEDKIREMMNEETWMSAEEALADGFIDQVSDAVQAAAYFDLSRFKYRNIPEPLKADGDDRRVKLARMSLTAKRLRVASNRS